MHAATHDPLHHHHVHWNYIFAYAGVFILLAIIGYYMSIKPNHTALLAPSSTKAFTTDLAYYDMPRISVVVGNGVSSTNIRLDMSLEVEKGNLGIVEGYEPRMTAKINRFLMSVDPERIQDAKWLPWLRSEMLSQINSVGDPVPVHGVMFRQLVIM